MKPCDRCGNLIHGTTADPIHVTSIGTHCAGCIQLAWSEHGTRKTKKEDGRGAAAKSRWSTMTPEAKAAHVAKMQAGRGLSPGEYQVRIRDAKVTDEEVVLTLKTEDGKELTYRQGPF